MRVAAPLAQFQLSRRRLGYLLAFAGIWILIIIARLLQLQVLEHQDYAEYARRQQTREVPLLAPRGEILDREGKPLALSLSHDSIAINPMRVPDTKAAATLLAKHYGFDRKKLEEKIALYKEKRWGFLWIRRWSSTEEANIARRLRKDKQHKADWIELYKEYKRYYPKQRLASHVLGSVGVEGHGLFGLEYGMNDFLAGEQGEATVLQDVLQRGIETDVTKPPSPGGSITLTIDQRIQGAAEAALRRAIKANHVPSGSVVVMNPHNGDLLAVANYPDFDPNERPRKVSDLEARINRAISAQYEPGSVFKVITTAAGLEQTKLRPDSVIDCGNGSIRLPGRTVRDHHSYSALTMTNVLAKSSNIGSIHIAFQVGRQKMYDYVRNFGFGSKTGLELPFEAPGYVWPMHKIDEYRTYSNILASVAMGHQISGTTVQLAQACSVVANGGHLVRPRILLETVDRTGEREHRTIRRGERVLRPETAITVRGMMEQVMLEGTGKAGRLAGWTAGGKTGTAQMLDPKTKRYTHIYHASFMGFAPLHNPAVVIVVTLDGSRLYGGTIAAPVFQEVASETLRVLGVPMDNPATAVASAKLPKPTADDVAEGDGGLTELAALEADKQFLPDTRKELVQLMASALKQNPDFEEWMQSPATAMPPTLAPAERTAPAPSGPASAQAVQQLFEAQESAVLTPAAGALVAPSGKVRVFVGMQPTPDFVGKSMRQVMADALEAGVEVQIYGRGVARRQIPPPGAEVPQGKPIAVLFTP